MTDQVTLILAAGESTRWEGKPKQLLTVPPTGETIIGRIERQVHVRGGVPYVVTHNPEIIAAVAFPVEPDDYRVVCDTLVSTASLWCDRTIILLGDVVFSKKLMDRIFEYTGNIGVFANRWEIFALSFARCVHQQVLDAAAIGRDYRFGKLRYFYNAYVGQALECYHGDGTVFQEVLDWTMDVDGPDEYKNLRRIAVKRLLDDRV